jgi:hypothetical protein
MKRLTNKTRSKTQQSRSIHENDISNFEVATKKEAHSLEPFLGSPRIRATRISMIKSLSKFLSGERRFAHLKTIQQGFEKINSIKSVGDRKSQEDEMIQHAKDLFSNLSDNDLLDIINQFSDEIEKLNIMSAEKRRVKSNFDELLEFLVSN